MFDIKYRIVDIEENDSDELEGNEGYFMLICNEHNYGEIFPPELDNIMGTVSIYWYFIYLLEIVDKLKSKKIAYLSDIDSYNTWIEFKLIDESVVISVGTGEQEDETGAIEYIEPSNFSYSRWMNQTVDYDCFKNVILEKATNYSEELRNLNPSKLTNTNLIKLKNKIAYLIKQKLS
ncbi:hypothetical protein CKN80_06985 [Carnobacterium divergens]|uniref:hypothetical protein n=1 Tax=Carnobacterium divergens TaxID=2748 RepID=UPI001071E5DF|nr:hypothetical protein [Carnobacterium divergens]TFJ45401.1 hypothetical protein CKN79_06980 [Carnobacterium divergens]TFJ51858.1 hypothetical protein CKN80_06985 [Carnobacterium divergens]